MTKTMKLDEGTVVRAVDGEKIGKVTRFVVDPHEKRVSHLVLTTGVFSSEERVVPVGYVAAADEGSVALRAKV